MSYLLQNTALYQHCENSNANLDEIMDRSFPVFLAEPPPDIYEPGTYIQFATPFCPFPNPWWWVWFFIVQSSRILSNKGLYRVVLNPFFFQVCALFHWQKYLSNSQLFPLTKFNIWKIYSEWLFCPVLSVYRIGGMWTIPLERRGIRGLPPDNFAFFIANWWHLAIFKV